MSQELRESIYNNFNLRETEDLIDIWTTNNRIEWSDLAFEVLKEILKKRRIEPPQQREFSQENKDKEWKEIEDDSYEFTEFELRITDDEDPPDFYDPFEVLKLSKWIKRAALASIILTILYNLFRFSTFKALAQAYNPQDPNGIIVYAIAFVLMLLNLIIGIAITYFSLTTLAQILRILMEMEFNSRKAKS